MDNIVDFEGEALLEVPKESPINPAARRAPAGGPPEALVSALLLYVQEIFPEVVFHQVGGVTDRSVVSYVVNDYIYFMSWLPYEEVPDGH